MFDRIIVIGVGLIGGSFCLAARKQKIGKEFIGYDISPEAADYALKNNILDKCVKDTEEALCQYRTDENTKDLIVLTIPLSAITEMLPQLREKAPNALVMELGSAKNYLLPLISSLWGKDKCRLIPTHPIAGSENNTLGAAQANLFDNCKTVITPLSGNDQTDIETIGELWQTLGKEVFYTDIPYHDKIFAYTSHLPHFLSYTLMNTLLRAPLPNDLPNYSAGGLRDFTRIAASDARIWANIFELNRPALLAVLREFQLSLAGMRANLQNNDTSEMLSALTKARHGRHRLTHDALSPVANTAAEEFDYRSDPASDLSGELTVDGDKSVSHRALILGSLAKGVTQISGLLTGKDTLATLNMFRSMGVDITRNRDKVEIKGVGMSGGLKKPRSVLDCENSGTAARLMSGLLCGEPFVSYLNGDASLSQRPMRRVMEPLRQMGGRLFARNGEFLPLFIAGHSRLTGITYEVPVPSAQVKSAIMLAAIHAKGDTVIKESIATRDHTERAMKTFGYPVETKQRGIIRLKGGGKINAATVKIPADISSAAFFLVAATVCPDSRLILQNVGINPGRTGIIDIIRAMGGNIKTPEARHYGSEPVTDLEVQTARLKGIRINKELVPAAIDELPIVMIAAACAEGETVIEDAQELRVKESNRLAVMIAGLKRLGVRAKETADGAIICGNPAAPFHGGEVDSHGDHRIAMSFSVAGCVASDAVRVRNCASIATSFPNFKKCAKSIGLRITRLPVSDDLSEAGHR